MNQHPDTDAQPNPRDLIEQGARDPENDLLTFDGKSPAIVYEGEAWLSIALSLKRIADGLSSGDNPLLKQLARIEYNTREVL